MTRRKHSIAESTYNLVASQAQPRAGSGAGVIVADVQLNCTSDPYGDLLLARRELRGDTEAHEPRPVRPIHIGEPIPDNGLRSDIELTRITAIGLKKAPAMQRWTVLHDMARQSNRQGFTFADFESILHKLEVSGCTAYNRRVIRSGIGLFWEYDARTDTIYPTGYLELCARILELASTITDKYGHRLCDLFLTNAPGDKRDMYIPVRGNAADFEAAVLNTWYASKNNPIISREVLRLLFHRDNRSLRYLERRAGITVLHNEVETYDPFDVPLGPDGECRSDVYRTKDANGRTIWHFRLPNTYQSIMVKQHHARGQSRKASVQFRQWLHPVELSGTCEQRDFPGELKQIGRIYCETHKNAKHSQQRGNANTIYTPIGDGRAGVRVFGAVKSQCIIQDWFLIK